MRAGSAGRSRDRKSTRLNSSHVEISYAVFCLKKKKQNSRATEHLKKNKLSRTSMTGYSLSGQKIEDATKRPLYWSCLFFFFFNDPSTTEIYTLSLHDALPI